MTKIKLLLMMLLVGTLARAQMLTPWVVSSGGSFVSSGVGSLSQDFGEVAVQTLSAGSSKLTQGFEQPYPDGNVGIEDPNDPGMSIKLYPNPASNYVSVSIVSEKGGDYLFTIVDVAGREVSASSLSPSAIGSIHTIDVTRLSSGMYFMVIESTDKQFIKTIRFNKD